MVSEGPLVPDGTGGDGSGTGEIVEAPEQFSAAETAVDAAPETATEPAPAETAPVAAAPDVRALLAGLPEAELDALIAGDEKLRFKVAQREDRARQQHEAKLRRDAGTRDNTVRAYNRSLLEAGFDPDTVNENARMAGEFAYELAQTHATHSIMRDVAEASLEHFAVPEAERAALRTLIDETTDPGKMADIASRLIDSAVDARMATRAKELEAASKLSEDKRVAERVEAELRAQNMEQQARPDTVPSAPRGNGAGSGINIVDMSDADEAYNAGRISHAEYKQYRERHNVGASPGGR